MHFEPLKKKKIVNRRSISLNLFLFVIKRCQGGVSLIFQAYGYVCMCVCVCVSKQRDLMNLFSFSFSGFLFIF